jgi:hypothetical protein
MYFGNYLSVKTGREEKTNCITQSVFLIDGHILHMRSMDQTKSKLHTNMCPKTHGFIIKMTSDIITKKIHASNTVPMVLV